jgi:hypothetical protein
MSVGEERDGFLNSAKANFNERGEFELRYRIGIGELELLILRC